MIIAVISDTRIGTEGAKKREQSLENFLDFAGSRGWLLILNGDILDLWAYPLNWIMATSGTIVRKLAAYPDKIWIPGNHDANQEAMEEALDLKPSEIHLKYTVGEWTIFHGYQVDPALKLAPQRWFAEILDRASTELNLFNELREKIARTDRTNEPLIEGTKDMGNVILGHSHVAANQGAYMNCGCWCDDSPAPNHLILFAPAKARPSLLGWP